MRARILVPLLTLALAHGQSIPTFDVMSIKPAGDKFFTRPTISPGRLNWTAQLAYLIGYAYSLDFTRLLGKNLAIAYTIEATFDPATSETKIREMMQGLLADRFSLHSHRVIAEAEGYALLLDKRGHKLKLATDKSEPGFISVTGPDKAGALQITASRATMAQLATMLERTLRTPVWDQTGLTGGYDFQFHYARDSNTNADAPWVGTALQDTLGLTLDKQKGRVETLVVDSIESPSEN